MTNPHLRDLLSRAFGEPIHIPPEDFLGKVIAGCFCRQPCMSGDQRDRLNSKERRAVDDTARSIAEALTILTAEVERLKEGLKVFADELEQGWDNYDDEQELSICPDREMSLLETAKFTVGHLRRARTLIEEKPE